MHPAWIKFLLQGSHNTFPLSHPPRHLLQIPRLPDPAFLFHPAGHPSQNGSSQAPTGFRPLPLLSVSHCYFFRIFRQMPSRTGMRSTVCEAELPRLPGVMDPPIYAMVTGSPARAFSTTLLILPASPIERSDRSIIPDIRGIPYPPRALPAALVRKIHPLKRNGH